LIFSRSSNQRRWTIDSPPQALRSTSALHSWHRGIAKVYTRTAPATNIGASAAAATRINEFVPTSQVSQEPESIFKESP
jgi:hypothetical protein